MRKLLFRWLISAAAVYVAMQFVEGISAEGGWGVFLLVALIMGLVNAIIAPLIKLLTCPLILLTLGLFSLVVNALMLMLAGSIADAMGIAFYVDGFWPAFWGSLVISIVTLVLNALTGVNRKQDHSRRDRGR